MKLLAATLAVMVAGDRTLDTLKVSFLKFLYLLLIAYES